MSKFEITLISYLNERGLVAEIYYDSFLWAEVSKKEGNVITQFYSHPHQKHWEFPCEEAIKMLEKAKTRFLITKNTGSVLERMIPVDPEQVNKQGQEVLEGILNHPQKKMIQGKLERFGNVLDIYAPGKGGARYSTEGEFIGFLEP